MVINVDMLLIHKHFTLIKLLFYSYKSITLILLAVRKCFNEVELYSLWSCRLDDASHMSVKMSYTSQM